MRKRTCFLLLIVAMAFSGNSTGHCQDAAESASIHKEVTADEFRRAARNGDLETVMKGIEAGVDVDAKSAYGATALFFACDRGQEKVVNYLLEQGADPNVKDSFYKATPVTWSMMGEIRTSLSVLSNTEEILRTC